MTNVSHMTKKTRPSLFDKHLPDMDCGYLRRLLSYDFIHNDIDEGDEFGLFDIDGELLISGPTMEYIYTELGEASSYCEVYLVH